MDPGSQASMVAEFNRLRAIRKGKEGKRVRFAPDSTAGQMTAGAPVVVRYTGGYAEVVDTIMVVRPLGGNEVQVRATSTLSLHWGASLKRVANSLSCSED